MYQEYELSTDKYDVIKLIGVGGRNLVFLVENSIEGKKCIAKISTKEQKTEEDLRQFYEEIQIISKVKNPRVLTFFGYSLKDFEHKNHPIIFTEYMQNGTLSNILDLERQSRSPVRWTETTKFTILLGIAIGMKYLHSQNIIHTELRPSNILLDNLFRPYISNFFYGQSKKQDLTSIKAEIGYEGIYYISPEIIKGQEYDLKADIYSYSLIFYEIITGKRAYFKSDEAIELESILDGKRPDTSIIPNHEIVQFLEKCWSNDPKERPSFDDIINFLCEPTFYSQYKISTEQLEGYLKLFQNEPIQFTNQTDPSENKQSAKIDFINNSNTKKERICKVWAAVCGFGCCGKTSLVKSLFGGEFNKLENQTYGSYFTITKIETDFGFVDFIIWDISNAESFIPVHIKKFHIAVVVTDLMHSDDIEEVQDMIDMIKETNPNTRIYIAVTKCDRDMTNISFDGINELASENNCLVFFVSAKERETVLSMFHKIALDAIDYGYNQTNNNNNNNSEPEEKKSCNIF